ncbi:MAG: DNA methyltransferase [Methylophilaceae bacterium]
MIRTDIGSASLYNMDCMELLHSLPDKSFDLAIVDPPYFNGPNKLGYYRKERVCALGVRSRVYKSIDTWDVPGQSYFDELKRVSRHQIVWGINNYEVYLGPGRIVWDKVNNTSSFSDCEIAYCSLFDSVKLFRYMWNGMMQGLSAEKGTVQQGNKKKNELRIHPTQKPVVLYEWLLVNYAKPSFKIIDTHLGSMSLVIACLKLGYEITGSEIDPEYFKLGIERVKRASAQGVLFDA